MALAVDSDGMKFETSLKDASDSAEDSANHDLEQTDAEKLTAAQRARIERNRLRARALQDARLVNHPQVTGEVNGVRSAIPKDSGGGFLLEDDDEPTPLAPARPAPVVHPADQPSCLGCDRLFPQSFLFDNFDYNVCDECRDEDEAHTLVTRTEAKTEYLLKDCDLDSRPPPLRCIRRRNPHSSRYGDMRLYLRAQVEARALEVWGSPEAIEEERERREDARHKARHSRAQKRLHTLRMDVRSSLYDRKRVAHDHQFGPEQYDKDEDIYSRTCSSCGHVETYEKM